MERKEKQLAITFAKKMKLIAEWKR